MNRKTNKLKIKQFMITFVPTIFLTLLLLLIFNQVLLETAILLYLLYTLLSGLMFTLIFINTKKYKVCISFVALLIWLFTFLSFFWFFVCSKSTYCNWGFLIFTIIFAGYILLIYLLTFIFNKMCLRLNEKRK